MWNQESQGPPPAGELVRLLPSDFSLAGLSELELVADIRSADAREARTTRPGAPLGRAGDARLRSQDAAAARR